ncbi:unnamed protein product, partial [Pylaiella littoralis]
MVDVICKRCAHRGCTTQPSFGVAGGTRVFCARHAKEGMVHLSSSKVVSGAQDRSGGARGCGSIDLDGGTVRSGACAGEKRKDRSFSFHKTRASAGMTRADGKRTRQASFCAT